MHPRQGIAPVLSWKQTRCYNETEAALRIKPLATQPPGIRSRQLLAGLLHPYPYDSYHLAHPRRVGFQATQGRCEIQH